ncbi:hypothetical protein GY21_04190 [Cryobacterium roopkundense]|uniref:Putative integral membrane protein n=1 Tax=Cryobacterium roopkundense TaxID=1001240 RepID=A0A099JMX4_9MICO|nr:hypothetical protein [Cryobacterium roopkundense]KGJ79729.1 hypothetical protein GY21_04190 [Cryobacterium roopkundense]MBB5642718.1 putative integral membrane protein [Cryobacterium roopkundense]
MTGPGPAAASASSQRRPRFSTIVWGVILLLFAVYMAVQSVAPGSFDPTLWLPGVVIILGLVLVVAGVIAATRRNEG